MPKIKKSNIKVANIAKTKGKNESKDSVIFSFVWFCTASFFAFTNITISTIAKIKNTSVKKKKKGSNTIRPRADKSPTNFSLKTS